MRAPKITVLHCLEPEIVNAFETYAVLPGDSEVHAIIGKHGELRIHSTKLTEDAEIESKNLPKEIYSVMGVYNADEWRHYYPEKADE